MPVSVTLDTLDINKSLFKFLYVMTKKNTVNFLKIRTNFCCLYKMLAIAAQDTYVVK